MVMGSATEGKTRTVFDLLLRTLYASSTLVVTWFLADGMSFYTTAAPLRPHHPDYRVLHPAGTRGLAFGFLGTAMILLLFLYSARKRSRRLARFGSLARWLDLHIYLGIFGPVLITLHTAFKVSGLVAIAFWAMVAVALSGVFGRYVHLQIPRNVLGEARSAAELAGELGALERHLREEFALPPSSLPATSFRPAARSGAAMLASLRSGERAARREAGEAARTLAREMTLSPDGAERLETLLGERAVVGRRLERLGDLQEIFHHWHVVHKPFSYVLLVFMAIHIAVSMALGYTWIF